MAIVDDGEGHEKAMWVLLSNRRRSQNNKSQIRDHLFLPNSTAPVHEGPSINMTSNQQQVSQLNPSSLSGTAVAAPAGIPMPTPVEAFAEHDRFTHPLVEPCCLCRRPLPERQLVADDPPTPVRVGTISSAKGGGAMRQLPSNDTISTSTPGVTSFSISTSPTPLIQSGPTDSRTTLTHRQLQAVPNGPGASRGHSSGMDASGTETDFASSSYTGTRHSLDTRHANYLRWSYPLPIAIRLGNLPIVQFLLSKGAHLDVWGYNFATPLYIAVANAQRYDAESSGLSKFGSGDDSFSVYSIPPAPDDHDPVGGVREDIMDTESPQGTLGSTKVTSPEAAAPIIPITAMGPVYSFANSPSQLLSSIADRSGVRVPLPSPPSPSGLSSPVSASSHLVMDVETSDPTVNPIIVATSSPPSSSTTYCLCSCHSASSRLDLKEVEERRAIVDLLLKCGAPVDAPDLYSIKCPINAAIKVMVTKIEG